MPTAPMRSFGAFSNGRIWLGMLLLLTLAFYAWMGTVCAPRQNRVLGPEHSRIPALYRADLYNLQAAGFRKGHLFLDAEPPQELITAPNPYDPSLRPKVLYPHDCSYYQGRYYSYFGPAPALLVYAPFQALTHTELPSAAAVVLFTSLGFLALVTLMLDFARTFFPNASQGLLRTCAIALAGANFYLPLLRRPAMYEVAISAGSCFLFWSIHAAWRACLSKGKFSMSRKHASTKCSRPRKWAR